MAKGKGSGGKRLPAPAGSNASAAAGASVASDKAAKSAADKELRAECAKAFSYYRKGNETRAVKELERLVKSHPAHPFPRFALVRLAHTCALEQRQESTVLKRFKEAAEKARAAIDACPDSLILRLLYSQVCVDSPAQDDAVLRGLEENANRVQDLVGSSADVAAGCNTSAVVVALKHLKAMAIIDGKVLDLPLFPDIRGETMDPGNFGLSTRLVSRKAKSIKLDTHRDAERAASIRARAATDAARRFGVSRGGEKTEDADEANETLVYLRYRNLSIENERQTREQRRSASGTSNLVMARETAIQLARQTERDAKQRAAETPVPMEVDGGDGAPGGGAPTDPSTTAPGERNPAANRVRNAGGEGRPEAVADAATASKGSKGRSNGATNGNGHGGGGRADRGDKRTSAASSAATERARANKAAHQLVKRYWKSRVEADPGAILELTDIPVAELREFFSGKTGRENKTAMRDVVRSLAAKGRWRWGRCVGGGEECCEGGFHDTSEGLFRCLERRISRDVRREDAGAADAWLLPVARDGDVNLGGWMGGERSAGAGAWVEGGAGARPRGDVPSTPAMLLADAAKTDLDPEESGSIFAPTPGRLAERVCGRPAPLLSADPEVLRADAVPEDDSAAAPLPGGERRDAGSSEYEFEEEYKHVSFTQRQLWRKFEENPALSLMRGDASGMEWELSNVDQKDARATRVATIERALERVHLDAPDALLKLREHLLHPSLRPPPEEEEAEDGGGDDDAPASGTRRGVRFLRPMGGAGYASGDTNVLFHRGKFAHRVRNDERKREEKMEADLLDIELLCARNGYRMPTELVVAVDVNAAPPVASVVERARARDAHPTEYFLQYAAKSREIHRIRAARRAASDAAPTAASLESYRDVAAALMPVEDPDVELDRNGSSSSPESAEQDMIRDIARGLDVLTKARLLPLRALQHIAQFVAAREAEAAERRRKERNGTAGEGIRRRRGSLGPAERVPASSPEATRGRDDAPDSAATSPSREPVRLDDLGARLRNLSARDVHEVWSFCNHRWQERERVLGLVMRDEGMYKVREGQLSGVSPLFGMTGPASKEDSSAAEPEERRAAGGKSAGKKRGKGGKGRGGGGGGKAEDEWLPDESSRSIRLSLGVWRALYPETVGESPDDAGGVAAEAHAPEEGFMGERLVNWLYHEANEDQRPAVMHAEEEVKRCHDEGFEAVRMNDELLAGLLAAKLKVRRLTDETATLAGNVMADHRAGLTLRNLDPTSPVDAETLRKFWRRAILLRYKTCELRRALLALDLEELGHEVREIARLEKEYNATDEALVRLFKETEAAQEAAKKKNTGEMSEEARATLVAASDRREKILHELRLRIRINSERKKELAEEGSLVSRAIDHKRKTHDALGRDPINAEVETVPREAFGGDVELRVVAEREANIDAEVEAWRETGGDIPDETAALVEQCARIPRRVAMPLALAQERVLAVDVQMEGLLFERSEVVADLHSMEMMDHYHQSHVTLTTFLRDRLEKAATAAEAEEALREQERLLAEEGRAAEAKRAREEKAKAKRAEVRQRAKHLRERELEEAKAAEEAAHAEEARLRAASEARSREREAAALAAKAEAEAEAEAEFARRRAQLELEAKVREADDDEMIEAAKRASLAANDARRARDAATEKAAIDARARAEKEARRRESAAAAAMEEERRRNAIAAEETARYERCVELQRAAEEAAKEAIDAARRAEAAKAAVAEYEAVGGGVGATAKLSARATDFKPARRDGPVASTATQPISPSTPPSAARGDPPRGAKGEGKGVGVGGGARVAPHPGVPVAPFAHPMPPPFGYHSPPPGMGYPAFLPIAYPAAAMSVAIPVAPGSPESAGAIPARAVVMRGHPSSRGVAPPVATGPAADAETVARAAKAQSAAAMAQAKMAAAMAAKHADDAAAGESARPALAPPPDESAWPALAPPPLAESSSSASSVDEGGFAVDELNAALEASMRETKRPKGGAGASAASGSRETSAPAGPGAGLRNLEGEHNCFLNVVVQSLWHIPAFNRAVQTLHPVAGVSRADESVATALREVFAALDAAAGVKPPNAWGSGGDAAKRVAAPPPPPGPPPPSAKHVGAANGNANGHGKANGHGGVAVAPTALRKALAVLAGGEGSLFSEHEMADASEALQAIFHAVHRACAPVGDRRRPTPCDRKRNGGGAGSGRGAFLDEECGYRSLVHRCFGLDVEERMDCASCRRRTRVHRYTKFLHLVPATALNLALAHAEGVDSMEAAMRHIDGSDAKPCDEDEGGCGAMNGISHDIAGAALPEMFCVALTWDTASPERATVTETLGNVSTALDLAKVFEKMPAGGTEYRLRCVMCYYGEHYAAFAVSDAGAGGRERWLLFDDATTKEVGGWEDVVASCEKGRLQPCVLFYRRAPK